MIWKQRKNDYITKINKCFKWINRQTNKQWSKGRKRGCKAPMGTIVWPQKTPSVLWSRGVPKVLSRFRTVLDSINSLKVWRSHQSRGQDRAKMSIYLLKAHQPNRVTSGLFTKSNLTKVEYNKTCTFYKRKTYL